MMDAAGLSEEELIKEIEAKLRKNN